jgi:ssDNA-binding replication factor A large subunit
MTAPAGFMPLSELSPFSKNWVIKGRVTDKDRAPREFNRAGSATKGQVMGLELMDDKGSDIKVTFWNEACDKYSFMKKGEVYTMKGGSIKMKTKRYNNTSCTYEIHIDNNPLVQITEVDKAGFENVNEFQTKTFTKLDTVATMPLPTTVDLIVMVKSQQETREVKPKKDADTGKVVYARTLELVDATTYSLECTVWDEERSDESLVGRCIAIQKAYVKEYNNRSASTPSDKITVDPPVAETEALKQWWENGGKAGKVTALSDKSGSGDGGSPADAMEGTIAELRAVADNLVGDKKVDFSTVAYLTGCRTQDKEGAPRPITYDACPKTGRKLAGNYCQKCEKAYDAPEVRYILGGLVFEDASGFTWSSSVGNETGVKLLNTEAEEMKRLQYTSPEEFSTKINDALYQDLLQVKFRVRMEEYQGVQKPKVQVIQATPAKYVDCGKVALEQLKKLYAQCPPTAQAAVKELVAAWKKEKDSPTMIKGKAVFSPDWHEDMSRLMAETC